MNRILIRMISLASILVVLFSIQAASQQMNLVRYSVSPKQVIPGDILKVVLVTDEAYESAFSDDTDLIVTKFASVRKKAVFENRIDILVLKTTGFSLQPVNLVKGQTHESLGFINVPVEFKAPVRFIFPALLSAQKAGYRNIFAIILIIAFMYIVYRFTGEKVEQYVVMLGEKKKLAETRMKIRDTLKNIVLSPGEIKNEAYALSDITEMMLAIPPLAEKLKAANTFSYLTGYIDDIKYRRKSAEIEENSDAILHQLELFRTLLLKTVETHDI